MKSVVALAFASLSTAAAAAPVCYQLSTDGQAWSRTPETLCVDETDGGATITLQTGLFDARNVATFNLDLLQRLRCFDCNGDVFGISNPSNSIFNQLSIAFTGNRDAQGEAGTVKIGETTFFYRSAN